MKTQKEVKKSVLITLSKIMSIIAGVVAISGAISYFVGSIWCFAQGNGFGVPTMLSIVAGITLAVGAVLGFASVVIRYIADPKTA